MNRVLHSPLNGRLTAGEMCLPHQPFSYEDAKSQDGSNHWSCTENNRNNARNVNFNNGNTNNNNKYNSQTVRPVSALGDYPPESFVFSVWEAYHDCIKGKMRSKEAIEYMPKAEKDIPQLAAELWSGTYKPGTSTCFLVRYPKWREVFAAGFRDRIVHHWVCLRLEPLFEERFHKQGNVSFNCRKGFGVEKAVEYVTAEIERISECYRRETWVFRGDLTGFFMSIDKKLLWYLIERFTIRKYKGTYKEILLRTVHSIVMHHPERDCVLNSPPHWWNNLPASKSLFTNRGEVGMPIGNLTTQLFANFLMSHFVAYVQYLFRRKNFAMAQFVDDFVIVCNDKRFLIDSIPKIEKFLSEKLHLSLHRKKRYLQPASHGVLFVGTFIKPRRNYLQNRTRARFIERCQGFRKILEGNPNPLDLRRMEQVLNSYLGFTRRRRTYTLRREAITLLGCSFWKHFYIKGHYESARVKRNCQTINI
ncbi:MAG: RNA-directed DNA polymerase [Prevotella sp.]|nr:RNA-directed DNA polymerase [Prevotella sp.]